MIYYGVISISCLFAYIGYKLKNKILCFLFSLIAILIPSLIAGYRDTTVGMDLAYYAVPCFDAMCETANWKLFVLYMTGSDLEPLYVLYNYLVTRFTMDIFWALFIQQIIVLGLILITCYRLKDFISVPALYSIFILLCYVQSMSANRQIFAIAVVFFSFYYVIKKNVLKYILIILLATLFHYSAVIALPIYWVYNYCLMVQIKNKHLILVFIIGFVSFVCFPFILQALIDWGLLASKYLRYADDTNKAHTINLIILGILYLTIKFQAIRKKNNNIIFLFLIIVLFMYLCGVYNDVATRVAWYYLLFASLLILKFAKQMRSATFLQSWVVLLFAFQFVYLSITTNFADAIPYTSKELRIKGN